MNIIITKFLVILIWTVLNAPKQEIALKVKDYGKMSVLATVFLYLV